MECREVQENLVEMAGEARSLQAGGRLHLEGCAQCQTVAAAELELGTLFDRALAPADHELQQSVMIALTGARRRRRVLAFLPVAASLLMCCVGVALLGGFPGGSLTTLLPKWSSQGWMSLAMAAQSWQLVLAAASGSLANLVPLAIRIFALLLTASGVLGMGLLVSRFRGDLSWQQDR